MSQQGPHFQQFYFAQQPNQIKDCSELRVPFTLIACVDLMGGYSKDGKIPWHYKEDMEWFKLKTTGHTCIMGLNTYNDMARMFKERGKAIGTNILPNRNNYVVSSTATTVEGATVVKNWWNVKTTDQSKKVFIIGGARLWRECLPMANEVILTVISKEFDCDQFFPTKYLMEQFQETQLMETPSTKDLRFITWTRIAGK